MDAAPTEALAVREGRIVYVGPNAGLAPFLDERTRILSLPGRMVLPAFHDCHVHPAEGGVELGRLLLDSGAQSPQEWLDALKAYALKHPEKKWIVGSGWANPLFQGGSPDKALLDAVVSDRPVFLASADGHSAWCNSLALKLAGISKDTPDPEGGRIERNPEGTLRESAIELVGKLVPEPTREEREEGARRAIDLAHRFGITTLHDAHAREGELRAYADLEQKGELSARIIAALHTTPGLGSTQVPAMVALRQKYASELVRPIAAKIFADGVVESRTAALLEPYKDGTRGILNFPPEELTPLVVALDKAGFQVHVHAIGDRAVRVALDAFEQARRRNGARDARHHIAHLELVHPDDLPRFRQLDVGATIQPLWAFCDPYIRDLTLPILDTERTRRLYPLASLAENARLAGGSDWTVSSMNPLEAMQVAVTRRGPEEGPGEPFLPDQRLDLKTVLEAYTVGGAYRSFQEYETGTLSVGKSADLVVLERDLFQISPHEIGKTRVLWTFFRGRPVYHAD